MSSKHKNLSDFTSELKLHNAHKIKVGIVVAEWNNEVTFALRDGAIATLKKYGIKTKNIQISYVPGSFELTLGAQWQLQHTDVSAVLCLGCVIQGETRHFDFICDAVANGITQLNVVYSTPVIFGVLTPNNQQQAIDRAGGKHGNKGDEAAFTALKMLELKSKLSK